MNSNFADALQAQLDAGAITGVTARRVKRILDLPDSNPRKAKVLARMEQHARAHLGIAPDKSVNWKAKAIDWASIIDMLVKLLPLILQLFGL